MKKLILLLWFVPFIVISQERINKEKIEFDQIGTELNNAEGWTLYDGEWHNKENEIPFESSEFNTLKFRVLNYNDKSYYVFTINSTEGFWEYPDIQVGFFQKDIYTHYIFSQYQFENLKNFKKVTSEYDYFQSTSELKHANKLIKIINGEKGFKWTDYELDKTLEFRLEKLKGETVRFILPTNTFSSLNFDKNYFEISLLDFKKLMLEKLEEEKLEEEKILKNNNEAIKICTFEKIFVDGIEVPLRGSVKFFENYLLIKYNNYSGNIKLQSSDENIKTISNKWSFNHYDNDNSTYTCFFNGDDLNYKNNGGTLTTKVSGGDINDVVTIYPLILSYTKKSFDPKKLP